MTKNIIIKTSVQKRFDSFMVHGRVLFFSAPCGFGKTVLADALLRGRNVLRQSAADLDCAIPPSEQDWDILLIDDLQLMQEEAGQQALCELIRSSPERRFVLLSRGVPPGCLTAFQYTGLMTVLEADDLLFDADDVRRLFQLSGVNVTDSEIDGILKESVGYPLGVAITARCMSPNKPWTPELVARVLHEVFLYFETAIYRCFDLPVRRFLLELAPFESFDLEMARMVSGDPRASERLGWLLRYTTMLRYDDCQRFHFWPGFRAFLLWEMEQEYTEEKRKALFSRGGLYYELKEDYAHALECYTGGGDHSKVSELLVRNAELHPGMGHYAEMEKYYRGLPETEILASPSLMQGMSMLCALAMDYEGSERWYGELQKFAEHCGRQDAAGKQARSRLAWLEISLPQRGVNGLTETIPAVFRLLTNKEVALPSFSVTSALPSIMNGGKLSLSNGTFSRVAVKDDGSSASLSGGSYGEITSDAGYVKPYALLAKGYAYKKTKDNQWLPNANSIPSEVTVEKAPFAVEKIYPNSDTNYTGNSAFATDGSITLTAVIAPETQGVTYYYWWERYDESSKDWTTKLNDVNTATHTGGQSKTLSISNLPENSSYQYHVYVSSDNGYNCYSEPFTVTRHQHSWTYTASGATITASCTDTTCTSPNGGSVTIKAPAELTYSGEGKPATVAASSDWQGPAASGITISYIKTGTYGQQMLENGTLPTNAGEYTASITVGEGNKAATASVKYTIQKANPVVTEWPTLSASVYVNSEATLTGGSGEGTFAFKAGAAKSWDSAGSKTTTIVFTPTDTNNYKELTQDYNVTVVKRTVKSCNTLTGITDKSYGTALEELGLPETVTITTEDGKTFDKISVTWSGYNPNTLEEQTLTGTLDLTSIANEVEQPGMPVTAQIKVKLTTKSFSGISAAAYEGVYDGSPHGITLTGVPSGAIVKYGESADSCTQDSLTYTDFTNGAKTVYYKVSQSGYADASGSATVNITKRPLTVSSITENKTYAYASGSDGKAIGVNIAGKLPTDRGTTAYAVAKTDTEKLLSEVTVDTAGNLTYKVNQVDASKVGKTAIITVTASMENYANAGYTLTISITDKKTVEIKSGNTVSVDGSNALTYGEKVSKLTLGNTVFVEAGTDDVIEGILSWSNPDEIPAAGTTQAGWVFKPADSTHYAELTGTAAITVAKATPIVVTVPTVAERGYNPDAALTGSDITGGSVTGADGNSLAGTWSFTGTNIIPTVNNKGYQAVFTPDDTNNYNTVTRTITVTVNKAAKAPNMPEAAMTPAHSTKKVGNITLQEGWSWQEADKDTVLADGVAVTATAVYIGADKGNYETESVSITITRRECDHMHTEIRNQREATCTQTGYAGDTYCTDCDKLLSTGKELAALGHDYKATVTKQSTTTEEGVRTYTCTRCGHSYTESIAKLTSPSPQPTATPSGKPETPSPQPKGTNLKDDTGAAYKVTSANGKTPAVQYIAPKSGVKGTVTVPLEVTIDGVTYKVTSIAGNAFKGTKKIKKIVIGSNITSIGKNAFAGCTSLTSITIGKNVTKIGKNAFTGCKKLKSITIKTKKLTTKTVKKGAFNGISKKVVVKVPKSKYKTYKKLLPAKGLKKAAKIRK